MTQRKLLVQPLEIVETRKQHWAYTDLIPLDVITLIAGRAGIGKSTIIAWLSGGFTSGKFPGDYEGKPVSVGFISAEDDSETTLVPRLQAAGANLRLTHNLSTVETTMDDGTTWRGLPKIATDLAVIKDAVLEFGIKVLIIDPVVSVMDSDSNKEADVRRNLDPVAQLAHELGISVIIVKHFNKGGGNAGEKISGSHAFRDVAKCVVLLAADEESGQRILTVDKNNYSANFPSLAFDIQTVEVATDDGEVTTVGRARLLGESTVTVQDIINRESDRQVGDLSREIIELLEKSRTAMRAREISDELGEDAKKITKYCNRLVKSGRIGSPGRGLFQAKNPHVLKRPNGIGVSNGLTNTPLNPHTPSNDIENPSVLNGSRNVVQLAFGEEVSA